MTDATPVTIGPPTSACANATGFRFEYGVLPTRAQLRRMCSQSACIADANEYLLNGRLNPNPSESYYRGLAGFVFPLVDFCYFHHEPAAPCPVDFLGQLWEDLAPLVDACESKSGFSLQNLPPKTPSYAGASQQLLAPLCGHDECDNLMRRLFVKDMVRTCPPFPTAEGGYPRDHAALIGGFVTPYMEQCNVGDTERWYIPYVVFRTKQNYVYLPGPLPGDPPYQQPTTPSPPPTMAEPPSADGSESSADSGGSRDDTITFSEPKTTRPATVKNRAKDAPLLDAPPQNVLPLAFEGSGLLDASTITLPKEWTPLSSNTTRAPPRNATPRSDDAAVATKTPSSIVIAARASSSRSALLWGGAFCISALVLLVVVFFAWRRRRQRRSRDHPSAKTDGGNGDAYQSLGDARSSVSTNNETLSDLSLRRLIAACRQIPAGDLVDVGILGGGGSGVVYLVRDTGDSDRLLASKRIRRNQHAAKDVDAFMSEINLVARLSHPRVVALVGFAGLHRTELQALFEYMAGGDLKRYLDLKPPIDPARHSWTSEKVQIALDVADALVYLHSLTPRAVVHRDLKSRNIMLTLDNRAKLGDFGVSRDASSAASMTTGVGTSRWLAPEVILGGGDYDTACDVYSFGVVLTELDTHRVPFAELVYVNGDQLTDFAVLEMIVTQRKQPTRSESCPAAIEALIGRCVAFDPSSRPTAHEVAIALRKIQQEMSWQSPSPSTGGIIVNVE